MSCAELQHLEIIIGSGIGGLTTGVLLSKVGKKVLVLEQHDQAGGCCHTFIDKGYEFDVGIHYIGEIGPGELNRTLVDEITEGQLEWEPLESQYDQITIGYDKNKKTFPVWAGNDKWKNSLIDHFPDEKNAIEKFFKMVKDTENFDVFQGLLKLLPLWLSWLITKTGLIKFFVPFWSGLFTKSTQEIVESLTKNKDLQTIFTYCWGDYGSPPQDSSFIMQGMLVNHFAKTGGYYPIGGASEIAFNMIPVIEKSGGAVLVRANVKKIICNDIGQACGVLVKKGSEEMSIAAPIIISNAGAYNTFQKLLPQEISEISYYSKILRKSKPGMAAISIFVGLDASNEDLNLKAQNTWAFTSNDCFKEFETYINSDPDLAQDMKTPLLFVSFPSAKDPKWSTHPGRKDKSTCAIVTISNFDWFKAWENQPLKRRGDDYDSLKKTLADNMIEQACVLFPQIREHIAYIEIGTPITNNHYLASPHGEIYGLDHGFERFDPWKIAQLRASTDISGLYLTGQDSLLCGFTGALFGGLLCAGSILGRNVMGDLEALHAKQNK